MATMSTQQAYDLAVQHHRAGQFQQAETIYRQIIAQQPNHAAGHYMLAVMGHQFGRSADALPLIDKAISLNPGSPDYHMFRGIVLVGMQRYEDAVTAFRHVTILRPGDSQAYNNLANAQRAVGQLDDAVATYRKAIELEPEFPEAYSNLSTALKDSGRFDQAIDAAKTAIAQRPNYAGALCNLGVALKAKGQLDEAMDAYRQAIQHEPNYADGYYNIGNLHKERGELDEAATACEKALSLRPDFPSARWNLSLVKLMRDDPDAWEAYEARWLVSKSTMTRGYPQPLWDGSDLSGRTILLHAEQGLGDTIQFIRYAPMVKEKGGTVVVLCQPELSRLLSGQLQIDRVVSDDASAAPFDVHCPLLSLPRVLKTTPGTIPGAVPYLSADSNLVEQWRQRISQQAPGLKVGLVWAGRPLNARDEQRSLELAALAPLAQVEGVEFYSLQKGEAGAQASSPPAGMRMTDWTAELGDFADTAALVSNLDLVISVDTSVAHLAGALANPVWTFMAFSPDWRWKLNRSDTPWYPTMRLFRQPKWGDWNSAIEQVAEALRQKMAQPGT
jgi:tetratricopeptide (TPR) repeat protein